MSRGGKLYSSKAVKKSARENCIHVGEGRGELVFIFSFLSFPSLSSSESSPGPSSPKLHQSALITSASERFLSCCQHNQQTLHAQRGEERLSDPPRSERQRKDYQTLQAQRGEAEERLSDPPRSERRGRGKTIRPSTLREAEERMYGCSVCSRHLTLLSLLINV